MHEFTAQLDLRAVAVDSPYASFTEGSLGLLRFDEAHDGIRLGALMLDASGPITETLRYTATAYATGDGDQNPIDLTEAFVDWRPYPQSAWRSRTRVGAFYPPVSLENRAIGWQSLYSISASAINTWLGEELRVIGAEAAVTAMGAPAGRNFDINFVAAVYGWNDPLGVLIFQRGWAIHDRQTALFGELPRPFPADPSIQNIEFFDEVDSRAGYYVGAELKWSGEHVLRALHYDNRGDVDEVNAREPTWLTRFDALGVRFELPAEVTFMAQYMNGDTGVAPSPDGRGMFIVDYESWFALLSYAHDAHRFTLRHDRMLTEMVRGAEFFNSAQNASAWTAAYTFSLDSHWQFVVEGVRINGSLQQRALLGLPVASPEELVQLAVRFTF